MPAAGIVINEGDSLTVGPGVTTAWPAGAAALLGLGGGVTWTTTAVSGSSTGGIAPYSMAVRLPTVISLFAANAGPTKIATGWCGTNDLGSGGASARHTANRLLGWGRTLKAKGIVVILGTIPARDNTPVGLTSAQLEVLRLQVNDILRDEATTACDTLVDIGADVIFGDIGSCSNTAWYLVDKLHPAQAGHTRLASLFAAAIQPYVL